MDIDHKKAFTSKRDIVFTLKVLLPLIFIVLPLSGNGWAREFSIARVENKQTGADRVSSNQNIGSGERTCRLDGKRKYLLYIPAKYDALHPASLVLFFHGGGGHMEQAASDYSWKEKAEQEGFILAFPNSSSILPRKHLAIWNAGRCCGYARDKMIDDIEFVKQVIADIYTSEHNKTQIELVVTEKGSHSWPGGKTVRGKKPSQVIIANDIIWDFFLRQAE